MSLHPHVGTAADTVSYLGSGGGRPQPSGCVPSVPLAVRDATQGGRGGSRGARWLRGAPARPLAAPWEPTRCNHTCLRTYT